MLRCLLLTKGKVKAGAAIGLGFGPNLAAMLADGVRDGGEADPSAFELRVGMQAVKGREEFPSVFHATTNSVVFHLQGNTAIHLLLAHLDFGDGLEAGVLQ